MTTQTPSYQAQSHLAKIKAHFDQASTLSPQAMAYRRLLAGYFNLLIPKDASVLEVGCGAGELLFWINARSKTGIDLSEDQISRARRRVTDADFFVAEGETLNLPGRRFDYIVLSDSINLAADVQRLFERLQSVSHPETRLILNFHSNLWKPLVWLSTLVGLREKQPESNWLTREDVAALLRLSDWELIKFEARLLIPIRMLGFEAPVNRWIAPLLWPLCLVNFAVARPAPTFNEARPRTVSVVIPVRNEAGNIENVVARTPAMGEWTELILVEGHSKDNTWEEMKRVAEKYHSRRIRIHRQSGEGKGNAVREGFDLAKGELLMILDADLTMPPEELPKFYDAVTSRKCEFANGCRLVYPMEDQAMRFLNMCANKAFSFLFSWLLGQPVKDTLCGTKVMMAEAYHRIAANRSHFGEFDPFGDFDLLFGASNLNLKILDIPIRYRERVYGESNIRRWRDGILLFRMVLVAVKKLKFV
jgi:ubiquinone/menaquinone biosynthesis C-methylase UbiE